MATITFNSEIDPNNAFSNIPNGIETVSESTSVTFAIGDPQLTVLTLKGTDFTYVGTNTPTGGILTGFTLAQGGDVFVTVEGLSGLTLPLAEMHRLSGAQGALLAYLLSGNDVTTAGPGDQVVLSQAGNDTLDGGEGADYIAAGDGDDEVISLLGEGPLGLGLNGVASETLIGGAGVDRLRIDRADKALPLVFDLATDGLMIMLDGTGLSGFEQMEFRSGAGSDTLAGAALADIILAGAGEDRISGREGSDTLSGGEGADSVAGGPGDDLIAGDAGIDALDGGSGNDTIDGGDQADSLFGAEDHDVLFGGLGADNLDGGSGNDTLDGGSAPDVLVGGLGDDFYLVDNLNDVLFDASGEGYDTVVASGSYILTPAAEIELLLTADSAATSTVSLTGNNFNNIIWGNAGANVINGRGGSDSLTGGRGRDTFVFDVEPRKGVFDRVFDFRVKDDSVRLNRSVFEEVTGRKIIDKDAFRIGNKAADAEDRIIYNSRTGGLFYDEDGTGRSKAVLIAKFSKGLKLTELDFLV